MRAARNDRAAGPAVVAGEDDQRVLAQALLVQRGDDPPDLLVERGDHRRVGAARRVLDGVGIAVLVGLLRLIGRMGRERGEVEEERLVLVLLLDELDRLVADQVQVIALLVDELAVALPVDQAAALVGEVVDLADGVAVEVIEAAVLRPEFLVGVTQVPFADHVGRITGFLQRLGQRPFVGRQAVAVVGEDHQRLQAVAHRIAAGHQGRAGRGAHGHAVEVFEPHTLVRELVDVRGLDVAAAIAEVGIAEVVGHDEDDVGFACPASSGVCSLQRCAKQQNDDMKELLKVSSRRPPLVNG